MRVGNPIPQRFPALLVAALLASAPALADEDSILLCLEEFSADYPYVEDAMPQCELGWDGDIAPSLEHSDYNLVWEAKLNVDAKIHSVFRSARPSSSEVSLECDLGPGGNPDVFGDYIVGQKPRNDSAVDNDMKWIRVSEVFANAGAWCQSGSFTPCPEDSLQQVPMHEIFKEVCGPNDTDYPCGNWEDQKLRRRIAAVTDGRFMVWTENWVSMLKTHKDLLGYRFPLDDTDTGTLFVVAADTDTNDPLTEGAARIVTIDSDRSIVVYERRNDWDDDENDADIYGIYLSLKRDGVDGAPFPIANSPTSRLRRWPDVDGDLIVWEESEVATTGLQTKPERRDIFGCQAPLYPAGHENEGTPDFTRCIDHKFRVAKDPWMQYNPAVIGDFVAWSDERAQVCWDKCKTESNIHGKLLVRDGRGEIQLADDTPVPLAVGAAIRITDEDPSRQRAPRAAQQSGTGRVALLWADTRFTGCPRKNDKLVEPDSEPGCQGLESSDLFCQSGPLSIGTAFCDDPIGAELAFVPRVSARQCQITAEDGPVLTVDLTNDWLRSVPLTLHERVVCEYTDTETGDVIPCLDTVQVEAITLPTGVTTRTVSCACDAPGGVDVRARYVLDEVELVQAGDCSDEQDLRVPSGDFVDCVRW